MLSAESPRQAERLDDKDCGLLAAGLLCLKMVDRDLDQADLDRIERLNTLIGAGDITVHLK